MSALALLAADGVAAARSHRSHGSSKSAPAKPKEPPKDKEDATDVEDDAAPEADPEAKPKPEPKPKAEAKPKPEPKPTEPTPEPRLEAPPPSEAKADLAVKAAPIPAADVEPLPLNDTIVGFSDKLFVRSPGGEVVVFPGGLVQVDAAAFPRQTPKSGAYIRRARVELTGWLGRIFYFDVSADFAPAPPADEVVAPSVLPMSNNYVALAPAGNRFVLQAGLFDTPFTLENRTADAYTDFIERAMVARSVGVPRQKEVGAMVYGLLGDVFYYSGGVFNGDGPDFRNLDNQPDVIGRVTVSPFARGEGAFRRLTLGGSGWYGRHVLGPAFPVQATPGGVVFVMPTWTTGQPGVAERTLELREHGTVVALAGELSVPFGKHFGLRGEFVYKQQQLAETEAPPLTAPLTIMGTPKLTAMTGYGEVWLWLAGDDQMLPAPGLQLANRIEGHYRRAFEDGLMLAFRGEFTKEDVVNTATELADPTRATTRVVSGTAGVNYWRGRFARISINYVLNMWSGTSETVKTLRAQGAFEHEVLLRFASSL